MGQSSARDGLVGKQLNERAVDGGAGLSSNFAAQVAGPQIHHGGVTAMYTQQVTKPTLVNA
jgi:hypothetical protein